MKSLLSRITIQPDIRHGKPVICGRRHSVESVLDYLAVGDSFEDVLPEYPDLEREDLLACLEFAAHSTGAIPTPAAGINTPPSDLQAVLS